MLDVHPPHSPTHTWKDFLIHIATITVGLLIAVGLEQTVEAIHHQHQAHELERNLQDEAHKNARRIETSYMASDVELQWLLGLQQDIRTMLTSRARLAYRPRPQSAPGSPFIWDLPVTGVWDAAKQSGVVALLPAHQAEQYTSDYHQVEISYDYRTRFYTALAHQQAYESKFASPACPTTPDLTRMNPQQLEQYSTLIGETFAAGLAAKNRLRIFQYVHNTITHDFTPEEAAADRLAVLGSHTDSFPPPAPGMLASDGTCSAAQP